MTEPDDSEVPPLFAAMKALDEAAATHHLVLDRLQGAFEEGYRLDEELRRVDPDDDQKLLPLAQALAFAVTLTQSLANREQRARLELRRAQTALAEVRALLYHARFRESVTALEDDAISLHLTLRSQSEALRTSLERHGRLADDVAFFERLVPHLPEARTAATSEWTAAIGKTGSELLRTVALGMESRKLPAAPTRDAGQPDPPADFLSLLREDLPDARPHAAAPRPPVGARPPQPRSPEQRRPEPRSSPAAPAPGAQRVPAAASAAPDPSPRPAEPSKGLWSWLRPTRSQGVEESGPSSAAEAQAARGATKKKGRPL